MLTANRPLGFTSLNSASDTARPLRNPTRGERASVHDYYYSRGAGRVDGANQFLLHAGEV